MSTKRKLPECCYSILSTTNEVIVIKYGESGYYPVPYPYATKENVERYVRNQNEMLGVLPEERLAMEIGSMFEWSVPGADPQCYLDKAEFVSKKAVNGHIKEKLLTVMHPINVDVYEYKLLNETRYFVCLEDMPKRYPLVRYEEFDGRKFVPVKIHENKNGTVTLFLIG